jgi:enoyl-CoA hydratase
LAFEVRLERDGRIASITIDNPPVNALHPDVSAAIHARLKEIAADPELRAVVITGAGKTFMAGGDIAYFESLDQYSAERYVLGVQSMQDEIGMLPQPVIAAVNGACLGGGCELAMACDIRVADERATFGQPEVSLGIIPGAGGTQNLPRLVGEGQAKRLLFTGERIDAEEARALGLVEFVTAAGGSVGKARELAEKIAANAPLAVAAAKRSVNLGLQGSARDGHRIEASQFAPLAESDDFREGVKAFFERRNPSFDRQ